MSHERFTSGRENRHRRPRGYADWNPQAKTKVVLDQIYDVLSEYEQQLPLTVRQIFYRLVATFDYPKDDAGYERLCNIMVRARRAKLIEFDDIRDDGVSVLWSPWYSSPADFWDDAAQRIKQYQRDRQQGQLVRVELWCEAAGMMPQLARVANRYSVPVYSAGGFTSLTGVRNIVDRAVARDTDTVLLHVGDFDPSGQAVFEHMQEDVAAFMGADRVWPNQQVIAERVALHDHQVKAFELPTAPAKRSDSRTARWQGETCQLEALPPNVLAAIVTQAIEGWLDMDKVHGQVELEQADQTDIRALLPGGAT